jgi:hypothetical protein
MSLRYLKRAVAKRTLCCCVLYRASHSGDSGEARLRSVSANIDRICKDEATSALNVLLRLQLKLLMFVAAGS